jgi:hypothetical protein
VIRVVESKGGIGEERVLVLLLAGAKDQGSAVQLVISTVLYISEIVEGLTPCSFSIRILHSPRYILAKLGIEWRSECAGCIDGFPISLSISIFSIFFPSNTR